MKASIKKLVIRVTLVSILGISVTVSNSQDVNYMKSDYYNNIVPKNPVAAPFGNFGSIPINYYTGLPEVSLKLLDITSRGLSVPVSINYDASGVRTDEFSGPVGLKWQLDAGGFISRELTGLPDEDPDNGYWKYAPITANYTNMESAGNMDQWVNRTAKNEWDKGPDEFVIHIPGRSIRFVFDKYGNAVPIPRQNVKISFTLVSNRINKFEVITEDGTKYTFGGVTLDGTNTIAVEQTKIEKLTVKFRHGDVDSDRIESYYVCLQPGDSDDDPICDQILKKNVRLSKVMDVEGSTINFFNSKWYLISIDSPTGDFIRFSYDYNASNVVYSLRPVVTKVAPVLIKLTGTYTWTRSYCENPSPFGCVGDYSTTTRTHSNTYAIAKFGITAPGSAPSPSFPTTLVATAANIQQYFYVPEDFHPNPGGIQVNHVLITRSSVILKEINSAVGNKIKVNSSARIDLINEKRFDSIELWGYNNALVKTIKFNFADVSANVSKDPCWLSEAGMLGSISGITGTWSANQIRGAYTESNIPDANIKKFVFDGVKDYNYWRLFLESVEEQYPSQKTLKLYEFGYKDRTSLRRRTTTMHDSYGLSRGSWSESFIDTFDGNNSIDNNSFVLNTSGGQAIISNGYTPNANFAVTRQPLNGMLSTITFPTNGKTQFNWSTDVNDIGPKLQSIVDSDARGGTVTRELEYQAAHDKTPVFKTYQEFKPDANVSSFMKYEITTSAPQNDSYSLLKGNFRVYDIVKVYNGPKLTHKGYQVYTFQTYVDTSTPIHASPIDEGWSGPAYPTEIFPFPKQTEKDYYRGLLSKHEIRTASGQLLRETTNAYILNPNGYVPPEIKGFSGGSYAYYTQLIRGSFMYGQQTASIQSNYRYRWATYDVPADWVVLDNSIEKTYDQGGDVLKLASTKKEYLYSSATLLPSEVTTYNSADPFLKMIARNKYTGDYAGALDYCVGNYNTCMANCANVPANQRDACENNCTTSQATCRQQPTEANSIGFLTAINQISSPVELQNWVKYDQSEKLLSVVAYKYKKQTPNTFVLPTEVWALNQQLDGLGSASNQYQTLLANGSGQIVLDSKMRKIHSFDSYNSEGNILQQSHFDGQVISNTWGSNSVLQSQTLNSASSSPQQTTYSYLPLIGLENVKDPNNRYSRFEYDFYNRLKLERDHDNAIQKRYRYHYYNQNESLEASFTSSGNNVIGVGIVFTSAYETREYGGVTYQWDFGDGTQGSYYMTSHAYSAPGTYRVTLTKSNPEYGSSSASGTITIYPGLNATICVDGPRVANYCTNEVLAWGNCTTTNNTISSPTVFNTSYSGGCPGTVTYVWQKQNGSSWTNLGGAATSNLTCEYGQGDVGTGTYRCVITDACGNSSTTSTITVNFTRPNPCTGGN